MDLPKAESITPSFEKESTPILCVEDDRATRALIVHILGKRFSRILVAKDGAEGLEIFKRHRPPIVVTDIDMPEMNGIDMARAIRVEEPNTQIIVITASGESAAILAAVDVGIIDYVLKPIATERLNTAVDKCFRVKVLERALLSSKNRVESILESIGDAFFALEKDWRFTYLNKRAEDHFKAPRAALLGSSFRDLGPDLVGPQRAYAEAMETQERRSFELFVPAFGRWHDVSIFPQDGGISVYLRDITEKKKHEDEIQSLAFHDKLTGLPNRALLQERLKHTIQWCKRSGQRGAILFLDLDRFKAINDSMGHEAGDQVLQEVARRLRSCLRDCDTVARLGGDEFVIILEGFDHPDNIHSVTHRLLFALSPEIMVQGLPLSITCSIGISLIPGDGETVDELLKASDIAMYHSKDHGKNAYHFYSPAMNIEKRQFLQLEVALRKAVKEHDFLLHYQPQFDLRTLELLGFEALVRWRHPELGLIDPDAFIPLAEETGLILLLGDWVLETACGQTRAWMDHHPTSLRMAVNLSGRQFWQSNLVESIARGLGKAGLSPDCLELEITESMVMRDVDQAIAKMHELAAMGIRLSMDDFGTGYSSLAALKRFPIHTLKIDKSFIKDVTTNQNDAAISASIIALAHTMNLTVIAEGIETREQLEFLLEKGCEIGQGYFFSKPIEASEAELMLAG
jgi:diguanylate cyclase (GGDEF)-like protein